MTSDLRISGILRADPVRWHLLAVVEALGLPDCWIGAGFVRNKIWDTLHDRQNSPLASDVDVIWFDPLRAVIDVDREIERRLRLDAPSIRWSVKNQARMHERNGDPPYTSVCDAMRYWPETATAIAVRREGPDQCHVAAPFGLDDLLTLKLRPTPAFLGARRAIFDERIAAKNWFQIWPLLEMADD